MSKPAKLTTDERLARLEKAVAQIGLAQFGLSSRGAMHNQGRPHLAALMTEYETWLFEARAKLDAEAA